MEKDYKMSLLYDFYKGILSDKQAEAIDLYYNNDLSLAEIAQELGITRQGVRDNIKRGEKLICETEEKLGLYKKYTEICGIAKDISDCADTLMKTEDINCAKKIGKRLEGIANRINQLN